MPQSLDDLPIREVPLLPAGESMGHALKTLLDSGLPALPVVDADGRLVGIFGEREFMTAIFPGYISELSSARFIPRSIDETLEKRAACRVQPVGEMANTEDIAVGEDYSDTQLGETFLHHRILIIPVVDADRRPVGVITRSDFFRALAQRSEERA